MPSKRRFFAVLPKTRSEKMRLGVFLLILLIVGWKYHVYRLADLLVYHPKEGDVIFQSLPQGALVDAIESVTLSPWSHCGVVMRSHEKWVVVEAIGAVRETPLYLWVVRGRSGFVAYRVPNLTTQMVDRLRQAFTPLMGLPYDFQYAPDDNEIYCSELVFKCYQRACNLKIGEWQRIGDLNWRPNERFIREMEGSDLPLDRWMITPVELTRSSLLKKVYP